MYKIIKATGEGQSLCSLCWASEKWNLSWNLSWNCFMFKIINDETNEMVPGIYCYECAKLIVKQKNVSRET